MLHRGSYSSTSLEVFSSALGTRCRPTSGCDSNLPQAVGRRMQKKYNCFKVKCQCRARHAEFFCLYKQGLGRIHRFSALAALHSQ